MAAAVVFVLAGLAGETRAQIRPPDAAQAQYMAKTTLVALNHANLTGNYTVLRDLGSLRFRANNTAARLAEVFVSLREKNLDLAPIAVFEAQFAARPSLDDQGRLRLVGQFPTRPLRVVFDIAYELTGNRWAISDISVNAVAWPEDAEEEQGSTSGDMPSRPTQGQAAQALPSQAQPSQARQLPLPIPRPRPVR